MNYNELKAHIGHSLTVKIAEGPDTGAVLHCSTCGDDIVHAKRLKPKLRIICDISPTSPREWSNIGHMVCWHRHYSLGDEQPKNDNPTEWLESWRSENPDGVVLPVFVYDHGGLTFSTSPFSDRWDSGQVGYIVATAEKIRLHFPEECKGLERIPEDVVWKVQEALSCEVSIYSEYFSGNCWGWEFTDSDGMVDSCWGYIGNDVDGIRDAVPEEAKPLVDEAWKNRA